MVVRRQRRGDDAGDELRDRDQDAADIEAAGERCLRQRHHIRREQPERGVAQEQRQAEGGEDLRQHRSAQDVADERQIEHDAEREQRDERGEPEHGRAAAEPHHREQRGIHAEHDELAMGEVDEVHHAPDERQAGREQGVDGAEKQAADDHLEKEHAPIRGSRSRGSCGRAHAAARLRCGVRAGRAGARLASARAGGMATSSPSSAIPACSVRCRTAIRAHSRCRGAG